MLNIKIRDTKHLKNIKVTMKRQNLRIIGIVEREDFQLQGTINIFSNIIEETLHNLMKEIPISIQEAYRIQNRLNQKRKSSHCIIIKTLNG